MAESIAVRCLAPLILGTAIAGCAEFARVNEAYKPPERPGHVTGAPARATFQVDADRGNPRVLFFLALSGGGSRAAVLSGSTMLVLEKLDLLREVDVISSVSGGSLPGAYYAASRDRALPLKGTLTPLAAPAPLAPVSPKLGRDGERLTCAGELSGAEQAALERRLGGAALARPVVELCAQAELRRLRRWDEKTVDELMARNYLVRWIGNWFWPHNIARYWFTAFDRSDIMAKTLEDNLYDTPLLGDPYTFRDLNPYRPYLILNSTNATQRDPVRPARGARAESPAFGSVFTFTRDDFDRYLHSDIRSYPLANAVVASSAFPLVFQNVTLQDFRPPPQDIDCTKQDADGFLDPDCHGVFLHVFDGGNSDNLGLRSVKRIILQKVLEGSLDPDKTKVVVLLVDAFTTPPGARRTDYDPRGLGSFFVDFNVVDSIDALLQRNRDVIVGEFRTAKLRWSDGDCLADTRNLPPELCAGLDARYGSNGEVNMQRSLVFYHFGFADVRDKALRHRLNQISTSFTIDDRDAANIRAAVGEVINGENECLTEIHRLVVAQTGSVAAAQDECRKADKHPDKQRN
jgi:predicted acylesterase/phospholipase RssA